MMQKIRFQGEEYILVSGAITTSERFQSGTVSYAHLHPNGKISRYGDIIGTRDDIEFLEEIEDIKPTLDGAINLLLGRSWF
jgi:hypothetical protein